jgi:hypothetical protein
MTESQILETVKRGLKKEEHTKQLAAIVANMVTAYYREYKGRVIETQKDYVLVDKEKFSSVEQAMEWIDKQSI